MVKVSGERLEQQRDISNERPTMIMPSPNIHLVYVL
jgi:hypothetical protein